MGTCLVWWNRLRRAHGIREPARFRWSHPLDRHDGSKAQGFKMPTHVDDHKILRSSSVLQNERTSPRGRIDAMLTNTQHILDNMIDMKKQLHNFDEQLSDLETRVYELQDTIHSDIINLTDEVTKLRIEIINSKVQ